MTLPRKSSRKFRPAATIAFLALSAVLGHLALNRLTPRIDVGDGEFAECYRNYLEHAAAARSARRDVLVVVGSSRVEWGFKARSAEARLKDHLDSPPIVHNFSLVAAGPLMEWAAVRRILASPEPPDYLLVDVNPMYCHSCNGLSFDAERVLNLKKLQPGERDELRALGWSWNWMEQSLRLTPRWWSDREATVAKLSRSLSFRERKSEPPPEQPPPASVALDQIGRNEWGDSRMTRPEHSLDSLGFFTAAAKREYFEPLQNLVINDATYALFEDMGVRCRKQGVRLRFSMMPETTAFRGWYSPATQGVVADLKRKLESHSGWPCIDARQWFEVETVFLDGHHLIGRGPEMYSLKLAEIAIAPWLANMPKRGEMFHTVSRQLPSPPGTPGGERPGVRGERIPRDRQNPPRTD